MLQELNDYAQSLFKFIGRRWVTTLLLIFSGALLEGVGLLMLLPVIELIFDTDRSGIALHVQEYFSVFGLETKFSQVVAVMAVFLVLLLVRSVINWLRDLRITTLTTEFIDHWRLRLFRELSAAPWGAVLRFNRSDIEYSLMADINRLSLGTDRLLRGIVNLFMLVAQMTVAFLISPQLTAVTIVFFILTAALFRPLLTRAHEIGKMQTSTGQGTHRSLEQFLSGLKLAKVHKVENLYFGRFESETSSLRSHRLDFASQQYAAMGAFQFASGVLICVVVAMGVFVIDVPLAGMAVLLAIMVRLMGPFFSLVQSFQMLANMLPAYANVKKIEDEYLNYMPTRTIAGQSHDVTEEHDRRPASVELSNVSFKHQGQNKEIISDLSLKINPGSFTAITGPSGAGKTTLVDLMVGLLPSSKGQVLLNGTDVNAEPEDLTLSYVQQDPFLLNVSLRENLIWPDGICSDEEIWQVLETVGIAEKVQSLSLGLETMAGERGVALSGGERQRLCLARALLRRPQLLILDEATNAIDRHSETVLLQKLEVLRSKVTVVFITHRPTRSFKFDSVINLDPDAEKG